MTTVLSNVGTAYHSALHDAGIPVADHGKFTISIIAVTIVIGILLLIVFWKIVKYFACPSEAFKERAANTPYDSRTVVIPVATAPTGPSVNCPQCNTYSCPRGYVSNSSASCPTTWAGSGKWDKINTCCAPTNIGSNRGRTAVTDMRSRIDGDLGSFGRSGGPGGWDGSTASSTRTNQGVGSSSMLRTGGTTARQPTPPAFSFGQSGGPGGWGGTPSSNTITRPTATASIRGVSGGGSRATTTPVSAFPTYNPSAGTGIAIPVRLPPRYAPGLESHPMAYVWDYPEPK